MAGNIYVEIELQSTVDKIWYARMDSVNLFPKVAPKGYKSIQVLEGNGKALGSIIFLQETPLMKILMERIEFLDVEKKKIVCNVFDGDFHKYCKTFKTRIEFISKKDGCLIKWMCDFEEPSDEICHLSSMIKYCIVQFYHDLDAYLLKA